MNGGVVLESVADPQRNGVAFTPAQQRAGEAAVDGHRRARVAGEVDRSFTDEQVEIAIGQHLRLAGTGDRPNRRAPQPEAGKEPANGQAFDEGAS
ncbi:hypothetical protein D3C81_2002360 [compost metagenome]